MNELVQQPYRLLVVDDDASIRATYRRILQPPPSELGGLEALISGSEVAAEAQLFQVTEADQGETAAELQRQALADGLRFPLAFIDMRMPPGWDGMRTAVKLREQDPSIYIVIATAFSDYDVNALQQALGHDVVLLRKPFNQEEVFQLARTLCQSWMTRQRLEAVTAEMEARIRRRTLELDQRNDLQALLIEIISRFIQVNTVNDLDDAVNWSLARLGRAIDVDSCSLFRFDAARDRYCLSHEWHALGIQPLPATLGTIPRGDIAPAHARFLRGEVFLSDHQTEPAPPELRSLNRMLDALYDRVMAVPLEIGARLSGFLAIGTAGSADSLDPALVQLLFTVGHAITSAQDALEARHRLNESRVMLERTESITHTGSWEWDVANDSVIWSAELYRIFKLDPTGRPPSLAEHDRLYDPESMRLLRTAVAACLADGTPYALRLRAQRTDGEILICEACGYPRFDEEQRITGLYGSLQDITELVLAEDELKKSQYIVSSTPDGIALLDENYHYLIVNQTYERYSGLTKEAFIGRSIAEHLGQAAFEQHVKPRFDRCLQGEIIRYAEWFDFPTLGRRFFSVTYFPYRDETNRVCGVVANSRDITELKLAEAALADSEARFRGIVENADEGIWQVDRDWRTVYVNSRMEDMLGCPPGTMLGRPIGDFMDQAGRELAAGLQQLREHGVRQMHDFRFVRADGGDLHVLLSTTPQFDAAGAFAGSIALVTDISQRIRQERALTATAEFVSKAGISNYCDELVRHVALTLGLDYVHIARLTPDGARVVTEAAWLNDRPIANWSYDLAGTPCSEVLQQSRRCIVADVQACYPEDADLRNIDAEGYVGEPVISASGEVLGLIVGVSRAALQNAETIQANLRILAARSAAEWQRQEALRLLRNERDTTRNLLQTVEAIIVALDGDGRITLINRKGCELLGYSEAELIGQDWFNFCLPDNPLVEQVRNVFRKALTDDLSGCEYHENPVRTRSGEQRLIAWHNSSIHDADGAIIGGLSAGEDITERRRAELALRASEERFHKLFEEAEALAIQGYLANGEVVFWNRAAEKIYGYSAEEAIGGNLLDLIIPAELRQVVAADVRQMVETGRLTASSRLRLMHKSGRPVSVYSSHALVRAPEQPPVLFCMDIDMSELDQAEAALKVALTKYKTLFDCFPLGITVTDPDGGILESNRAAESLLGLPTDLHQQRHIDGPEWRIVRGDGTPMPPEEYASTRALKERRRVENVEMGIVKPDGEITWISVTADLLPLDGYGLVISYGDITARRKAEEQVHQLAYFDALTSLPNRRLLLDRLDQALIASKRSETYGALMMLDLDNLKGLNDSAGHDSGDQLLIEAARRLTANLREEDTVARLGGDEFVLIMEDLGMNEQDAARQAERVAEKIRLALCQPYVLAGLDTPYISSASIGLALFHYPGMTVETLLKQADTALYRAKNAGRNRVARYSDGLSG